jgi:hypothetical protein
MASAFRPINLAAAVAAVLIVVGLVPSRGLAGPLDPMQFNSLGTLALSTPGTYTISMAGGTPTLMVGGTTYNGVVFNGVAVFDFSTITIASGAVLTAVKGSDGLPVALLSQSTADIYGKIDVSANGDLAGTGAGTTGTGGFGSASQSSTIYGASGGGGGGFGGSGGNGSDFVLSSGQTLAGGVGGAALADLANQLQGGSSGGGPGGAGAGGGAIEIGASQQVTITGEIDAIGGNGSSGGGGSGGGIFIHAPTVSLSGILDVQGGAGGLGNPYGPGQYAGSGGGGGGEILVDYSSSNSSLGGTDLMSGGAGGLWNSTFAGSGSEGQFLLSGSLTTVPEPSSLALLGISMLSLLGGAVLRPLLRRSRRPAA